MERHYQFPLVLAPGRRMLMHSRLLFTAAQRLRSYSATPRQASRTQQIGRDWFRMRT